MGDLRASGKAFVSSTRLRERVSLRFCFVNWRTTAADVEEVIRLLKELGGKRLAATRGERGALAPLRVAAKQLARRPHHTAER